MGKRSGSRLRRDWDHPRHPRARASLDGLRRERDEGSVRSGVGASGERSRRRSARSNWFGGLRKPCCGDVTNLRSADVLARRGSGPCRVDPGRVRDHRLNAARESRDVCKRSRPAGLRRLSHPGSLGRRHHSDRLVSGRQRSPRQGPRRRRRLRGRWSRLVASPRPVHPHHRASVRVPHRLWNRDVATGGYCCANDGETCHRDRAPARRPARLGTPKRSPAHARLRLRDLELATGE